MVKDGQVTLHEGNVTEYLQKMVLVEEEKKNMAPQIRTATGGAGVEHSRESKKERRQQEAQERQKRGNKLGPWKRRRKRRKNRLPAWKSARKNWRS
jgi:hypothetical protein